MEHKNPSPYSITQLLTPIKTCDLCKASHRKCLHDSQGALDRYKCLQLVEESDYRRTASWSMAAWQNILEAAGTSQSTDPIPQLKNDQKPIPPRTEPVNNINADVLPDKQQGNHPAEADEAQSSTRPLDTSSKVVDINLWTQRIPVNNSTTKSLSSPCGIRSTVDAKLSDKPNSTRKSDHVRSVSPESTISVSSVPYRWEQSSEVGEQDDSTTLQEDLITVNHKSHRTPSSMEKNQQCSPQEVEFWEGSEELRIFPANLQAQLAYACAENQNGVPDCVRSAWPRPKTVFSVSKDRDAKWRVSATDEVLLAARYRYGKDWQIIVVKSKDGTSFNDGKAAIVNYTIQNQMRKVLNGREIYVHWWRIWDPTKPDNCCGYVKREMGKKISNEPVKAPKRPPSFGEEETPRQLRPQKKIRSSLNENAGEAKIDIKGGEIIVRRRSDNRLVKLLCPRCDRSNASTVKELLHHLRFTHKYDEMTHNMVHEICGIPLDVDSHKTVSPKQYLRKSSGTAYQQSFGQKHNSATTSAPQTSMRPADGPVFIFRGDDPNTEPRIRPMKACDSAEKLFVNAVIAGVAKKDTLMLTVQVGDDEALHIMKGDIDDFNTVMKAVGDAGSGDSLEIVVTVEDLGL